MDCHSKCLKGADYKWEDTSVFRKPQATSHKTLLGDHIHTFGVLAASSIRLHIGKLGVTDGPLAFEEARAEIMSLQYADELARLVRVYLWQFNHQINSIFYGPVVGSRERNEWEASEETERALITDQRSRLEAMQGAIIERNQIH